MTLKFNQKNIFIDICTGTIYMNKPVIFHNNLT